MTTVTSPLVAGALAYAQTHQVRHEQELAELLTIPSISTAPGHAPDVLRCAEWLRAHLHRIGLTDAELLYHGGHPVVFAQHRAGADRPTILIYGHYDVQPPEPLEQWLTPPFEPTVREGRLYARGATDNKGQLFIQLKALESLLQAGALPLNVKVVLEGEEESGGHSLTRLLESQPERFAADLALISDTTMVDEHTPTISYGVRGIVYAEVRLSGPRQDLHSGVYGGMAPNPLTALNRLLAPLLDTDGRVTLPGFYDQVPNLSPAERARLGRVPFQPAEVQQATGLSQLTAENGYSPVESATARPSFDVHGLWGGYQGQGVKTIIPASAGAKFSVRLVPDQDPARVAELFRRYFEKHTPPGLQVEFILLDQAHGMVLDTDTPAVQAAACALEAAFGRPVQFVREGGSLPVVSDFKRVLGIDTLLVGFGLPSDQPHAPNEHFALSRFHRGIAAIIQLLSAYANKGAKGKG